MSAVPEPINDDGYTVAPTHLRIYVDEYGDEYPWALDGADDHGYFTEDVRRFASHAEAVASIPLFVHDTESDGVVWKWGARHPDRTPIRNGLTTF